MKDDFEIEEREIKLISIEMPLRDCEHPIVKIEYSYKAIWPNKELFINRIFTNCHHAQIYCRNLVHVIHSRYQEKIRGIFKFNKLSLLFYPDDSRIVTTHNLDIEKDGTNEINSSTESLFIDFSGNSEFSMNNHFFEILKERIGLKNIELCIELNSPQIFRDIKLRRNYYFGEEFYENNRNWKISLGKEFSGINYSWSNGLDSFNFKSNKDCFDYLKKYCLDNALHSQKHSFEIVTKSPK